MARERTGLVTMKGEALTPLGPELTDHPDCEAALGAARQLLTEM